MANVEIKDRHNGGGQLRVGKDVQIKNGCKFDITADITIGDHCRITDDVMIFTHKHGLIDHSQVRHFPLSIGAGVFIGARSIIQGGVGIIGEHAFIAPGSVVVKEVPPWELWGGNPAKKLREIEH